MLQNPRKTLGFKKNMVYKIPPGGGGGKPYPASGLISVLHHPLAGIMCRCASMVSNHVARTHLMVVVLRLCHLIKFVWQKCVCYGRFMRILDTRINPQVFERGT